MKFLFHAAAVVVLAGVALAGGETVARTVSVQGEASITLPPDTAEITIGVESAGASVTKALAENAAKMTRVVAVIRAQGIAEKDIATAAFHIQPRFAKTDGTVDGDYRPIAGYTVSNTVHVTVSDLTKVSKILDACVDAGANTAGQTAFRRKDAGKYLDQVRTEAVRDAHHQAEILATAAGVALGAPITITDSQASVGQGSMYAGSLESVTVTGKRAATPILSGQIVVTASVSVIYEMLPTHAKP